MLPADPLDRNAAGAVKDARIADAYQLAVLAALEHIADQVDEIAHAMSSRGTAKSLSRADREALTRLLALAHTVLQGSNFTARELLVHVVGDVSLDAQLKAALSKAVGANGPAMARRLGRLLARAEGCSIEGYVVQRLGETRDGALWAVRRA